MSNKKGQFFLIVTGVMVVILIGLAASVNNAIVQPTPTAFYDLGKNFDVERTKVIDYGIFSPPPNASTALASFIENFTEYAREKDPNIELVYVFGNQEASAVFNSAKQAIYVCPVNEQCVPVGGETQSSISLDIAENIIKKDITTQHPKTGQISGEEVTVTLGNKNYVFNLSVNTQFYFILRTEKGKEAYVSTNE